MLRNQEITTPVILSHGTIFVNGLPLGFFARRMGIIANKAEEVEVFHGDAKR